MEALLSACRWIYIEGLDVGRYIGHIFLQTSMGPQIRSLWKEASDVSLWALFVVPYLLRGVVIFTAPATTKRMPRHVHSHVFVDG